MEHVYQSGPTWFKHWIYIFTGWNIKLYAVANKNNTIRDGGAKFGSGVGDRMDGDPLDWFDY